MAITTLTQARTLIRTLTIQEKLYLLNDITAQLVHDSSASEPLARPAFPIFHIAEWPTDMPQHQEDIYDDRGR